MADSTRPSIASVVGEVTDTRWGQVLQTPHAYGVVEIHSPDGIARTRGIQLLTKLARTFVTPPVSLSALSEIADTMINEDVVSLILLVPVGTTLYLVSRGNGCVYLKRNTKLAKLLAQSGALSGDIQAGDAIIAATRGFVDALTQEEVFGVFDHLAASEVAEKLTMLLHKREAGVGGAALIFKTEEDAEAAMVEDSHAGEGVPMPAMKSNIFFSGMKALGRRMTTAKVRFAIRRRFHDLEGIAAFSPKRFVIYAIVALFIMSIVLGIRRQYAQRGQSDLTDTITQAKHSFDEGMALLELNPVKGRERLTMARDLLSPVVARKQRSPEAKEAKTLYEEVIENLTRAMHIVNVKPELYFDMALLKKDSTATDVSLFEQTIGVLDGQRNTTYTVGISPKSGNIVGGGSSLEGALHIALYGDKLYVWTPSGIHQIRLSDQKVVPNSIPQSPEWGRIADMTAFGGNLYLLDTEKGRIWKYVATEKGFSTIFEYLNPDTLPDLSESTNMAIDGSVWLGTTKGQILRFSEGKENSFSPEGLDIPLGKLLTVYTQADAKMIYVLDAEKHRVVVFDKDGLYMAQYVWEAGFVPTEVVVSEDMGKLFLLAEGKIYSVDLK